MVRVIDDASRERPGNNDDLDGPAAETSDADLAQALEQNPFVTEIVLDFSREQRVHWNHLLRVIAMRTNLETVKLEGESWLLEVMLYLYRRWFAQSCEQCSRTLPFEAWICGRYVFPPMIYLRFWTMHLQSHRSDFTCVHMEPTEREQGARSLAVALQRNTNIQTLELGELDDRYAIPILEGLRSSVCLKTFPLVYGQFGCTFRCDSTTFGIHNFDSDFLF